MTSSQQRAGVGDSLTRVSAAEAQSKAELGNSQPHGDQALSPDFAAKTMIQRPKRIFISNLNSVVGTALVEELRNDHIDFEEKQAAGEPGPFVPTQIVGTLSRQQNAPVPNGVTKIIKREKMDLLKKVWSSVDTVIYDLPTSDLDEVEFALQTIRQSTISQIVTGNIQTKTIILISTPMTWASTELREAPPEDEDSDESFEDLDDPKKQKVAEEDIYEVELEVVEEDLRVINMDTEESETEEDKKEEDGKSHEEEAGEEKTEGQTDKEEKKEDEEEPPEPKISILKKRYIQFNEDQYLIRQAPPKYQRMKMIENKALSILKSSISPNLKVYIVCPGFVYGQGEIESVLFNQFKAAWIGQEALKIVGPGLNTLPLIHASDLAHFVSNIIDYQPSKPYLFAVDQSYCLTQKRIIERIANKLGNGKTERVMPTENGVLGTDWAEHLTVNLKFKPSVAFQDPAYGNLSIIAQKQAKESQAGAVIKHQDLAAPLTFDWKFREGVVANMDKVINEFNIYRGLDSVKIFITGPPAVGKSHFAQKLAHRYNLPHLTVKAIIDEASEDEKLGTELTQQIEALKDKIVEELQADKKKKSAPIDRSELKPRLPEERIQGLIKWKLSQNVCMNRGFVLDGYPRSYEDARGLWLEEVVQSPPPAPEKEDDQMSKEGSVEEAEMSVEAPPPKYKVLHDILPQQIFVLHSGDQFLKARVKELPEEILTSNTHWNEEGMNRRIKLYRDNNEGEERQPVWAFFTAEIENLEENQKQPSGKVAELIVDEKEQDEEAEADVHSLKLNLNGDQLKMWEYIVKNIESTSVPYNFQSFSKIEEEIAKAEMLRAAKDRSKEDELPEGADIETEELQIVDEDGEGQSSEDELTGPQRYTAEQLKKIKEKELELLDERSQPIRQYLMTYVVPHLTEGLIEVCKSQSKDAIPVLIKFLREKGQKLSPSKASMNNSIQERREEVAQHLTFKGK